MHYSTKSSPFTSTTLILRSLLTLTFVLLLGSCGPHEGEESQITKLTQEVQRALDATKERVTELSPSREEIQSLTTDEINKLSAFEYRVAEFSRELDAEGLQSELSKLGLERWECFEIEPLEKEYRVFCRRRPQTYLRYIPRVFP